MKVDNLKLAIDSESLNIYIDNGDEQEPTHVVYWHEDEWLEDPKLVVGAMLKAIDLYNNDKHDDLLKIVGVELNQKQIRWSGMK